MTKKFWKRLISAVMAAVLAVGVCLPASAAATPALAYTTPAGNVTTLSVEDLPAKTGVYAVQVTLELAGTCTPVFTPGDAAAYHTERTETAGGNTRLTIYLVNGQRPLNPGGTLTLGTLRVGAGETLSLPAAATLHLLNDALASVEGAAGVSVPVRPQKTSGGGGGGGAAAEPPASEEPPAEEAPAALPYTDITEKDWFYEAARYVYRRGMMSGTTAATFDPEAATTRGMIVAILYRLEGSPLAGLPEFRDVPGHQYYARPIAWAAQNGIVSGYPDGTFAPEQAVTREQLAAILFRYARFKGYDTTARTALDRFADRGLVNSYAEDALAWAGAAGLIQGVSAVSLSPQGQASRAQTAAILMRMCEKIAE